MSGATLNCFHVAFHLIRESTHRRQEQLLSLFLEERKETELWEESVMGCIGSPENSHVEALNPQYFNM